MAREMRDGVFEAAPAAYDAIMPVLPALVYYTARVARRFSRICLCAPLFYIFLHITRVHASFYHIRLA